METVTRIFIATLLLLAFVAISSTAQAKKQTYIVHLDRTKIKTAYQSLDNSKPWYEAMLNSIADVSSQEEDGSEATPPQLLYAYETVMFGIATRLSSKQLELLSKIDGFQYATLDEELISLHTTHTPQFLGLEKGKGLWHASNLKSDVIIGVVDTGIWPEHPSFQDRGLSAIPSRWKGACVKGTKFSSSNCNRKLIGAKFFFNGYEATAIANGIFVSCSAGNYGPSKSTVSNTAPWIMTVGASYLDRSFPTIVKLGNGQTFEGSSLYVGKGTKQLPLVYGKTAGGQGAEHCIAGSLNRDLVQGKMVVCQRGENARTENGEVVKMAGGAGMLLINTENDGEELLADSHVLPASSLGDSAGKAIKKYMNSTKSPTASIVFKGTTYASGSSATPFGLGSGHVDPERASDPGLIYDISPKDYIYYLCSLKYTDSQISGFVYNFTCPKDAIMQPGDLNYPSFVVNFKSSAAENITLTYHRTVTNVGTPKSTYYVLVEEPEGVSVVVTPKVLTFNMLGEKLSYKVTFIGSKRTKPVAASSFGSLVWVSGNYRVRSPIAASWLKMH
ncbi:hypothetical protein SCA6_015249 [Theobroma cacao]